MTAIILIAVIVILAIWIASLYNSLVKLRNNRENAFADIDVQLKQRHDLIPQLVETVKGYASHEKETLERVINARNGAISAKTIDDKIVAENALTSALAGLKITLEAYPDLKANQNFLQLQEEISDLENKLAAVRRYFNSATKELNNAVETFPSNLIAGMFGFKKEVMFDLGEQRATLEEAPKSSSKDAIRRHTNPTEQEQFPVPAPALLVSLPGDGIAFRVLLPAPPVGDERRRLDASRDTKIFHRNVHPFGTIRVGRRIDLVYHRLFCQYKHHQLGNRFRAFVENGKQKGI